MNRVPICKKKRQSKSSSRERRLWARRPNYITKFKSNFLPAYVLRRIKLRTIRQTKYQTLFENARMTSKESDKSKVQHVFVFFWEGSRGIPLDCVLFRKPSFNRCLLCSQVFKCTVCAVITHDNLEILFGFQIHESYESRPGWKVFSAVYFFLGGVSVSSNPVSSGRGPVSQ